MKRLKKVFQLVADAGSNFIDDDAFKLSASLSYYTLFALGPVLIIIISLAGIFFGRNAVQGEVYEQLNDVVGSDAALQVQNIISNIQQTQATTTGAIIGVIVLIIAATGVFTEMQGSINFIWSVKAKPKKSWLKFLLNRLLSFSLILGLGFLLLVSLIINTLLTLLSDRLIKFFPEATVSFFNLVNTGIILVVITGLFTVIFKVLPDATISWKDALIGSSLTAALFLLGKMLIELYLSKSNLGIHYGAAASIVIILTWIYYSSMILYFGAEFTKVYALHAGEGIRPKKTAVFIIKQEAKEIPQSRLDT
ncbi:MAG: YihY/virulence factor BrkB family protein [Flavisolibacter sp.]|jgi:membrane protein|nr:YihY/virulence factor BrkB family protein [Flavisolibacter sp.]